MEREWLARLPGLGGLFAVATTGHGGFAMGPQRGRVTQLGEEVLQRLLADLAHALGAQGQVTAPMVNEALVLQRL